MTAASLTPPVAYRLGAWLAGAIERSHSYIEHDDSFEVWLIGGPCEHRRRWAAEEDTLDAAVLNVLDQANGGAP